MTLISKFKDLPEMSNGDIGDVAVVVIGERKHPLLVRVADAEHKKELALATPENPVPANLAEGKDGELPTITSTALTQKREAEAKANSGENSQAGA